METLTVTSVFGMVVGQVVSLVALVLVLLGLGKLASRLMDVPFNLPRLALAALVGAPLGSVGAILAYYGSFEALNSLEPADLDQPAYVSLMLFAMAVGAMLAFVGLELLLPRGTRFRPVAMVREARNWFGRLGRYRRILWILARHGLGGYVLGRREGIDDTSVQRRLARSLVRSMEEAGVVFVKLGQVLATRRDLLPPVFVEELGRLHSEVAKVPFERIRECVEGELGRPLEEVFAAFDPEPLAAASIAQAHPARLHGGEEVVVKVQRPGIVPVVRRDLDIIRRLARRFDEYTDWGPAIGVLELADGFAGALLEELDFEVEAANIAAVADATGGSEVRIPRVYEAYTGRRVLVMERLHGTQVGGGDLSAEEGERIARVLLDCLLEQVLMSGIFHADPHPGNILVLDGGGVGLLDYGSVGRLDARTREALQMMLLAIDRGDAVLLTDTLLDVVDDPGEIDAERLRRSLGQFMARYLHGSTTASMRMFTELLMLVTRFGLVLPAELAGVFRALATLEGTLVHLSPGFDTVAEAKRYAGARMSEQLGTGNLREMASAELIALLPTLRRLPRRLDRITDQLHKGRFTVQARLFAHPEDRRLLRSVVWRAVMTVLAVVTGFMSVGLFNVTETQGVSWPELATHTKALNLLAWVLLAATAMFVLRLLVDMVRDGGDRGRR
ncbi:AarF/ABC1/UbiB kinase family protein [Nocardiopsis sp. L17-MgMaSL7]|uniref:ABC1 kinase family protein n=1 Tax=Nocardiopsis sp. L17-MgMaSL7 TaxID=1938893 RepID=UPI000D713547|nr:AarF/UbiB family protein [Nocardiopsis sp. L17-MgMaSL7]PWV48632.1 ubiquinone biosynthesis protein [Nocardiopsis sp. L17-MgMaSL7]